ncbi:MFS transporter [Henriciella sp.]|uniref:MFS transporter n=1 Tax=Henriciella sp. TaxID=1968823 RepID=UPI002635350C|nr:MFS transporter [Henriciella sp.]
MGHDNENSNPEIARTSLRYGISVLLVVALVSITLNLVTLPFAQVANEISETYAIDDVKFSLLIGVFFAIPITLMSVAGGWLSDRLSRRNLLMIAIVAWTVGGIWTALAPSYEQMAAARMLVAAAVGIKFPLTMTWINDAFPAHQRARAIGALFVVLNIGPATSAAIAGMVLQGAEENVFSWLPMVPGLAPWRTGLLVLALLAVVPLPFLALLKDARRGQAEGPANGKTAATRSYPIWIIGALVVSAALLGLADTATLGWLPAVLKRQYDYSAEQVGFTFALIVMTAGIAGPLLAGFLDDRLHKRYGLIASLVTCGIACALCAPLIAAFAQPSAYILVGALLVSGVISVMAMTVAYVAIQSLLSADTRGAGTGLAHALENLSRAAAPTIVASVALLYTQAPGDGLGMGVATVCVAIYLVNCVLYAGLTLNLVRRKRRTAMAGAPEPAGSSGIQ